MVMTVGRPMSQESYRLYAELQDANEHLGRALDVAASSKAQLVYLRQDFEQTTQRAHDLEAKIRDLSQRQSAAEHALPGLKARVDAAQREYNRSRGIG